AEAAGVPVATSSMMQVPFVQATLPPGRRVGIVTISRESLTDAHLDAIGVPRDTPITGVDTEGEFFRVIIGARKPDLDVERAPRGGERGPLSRGSDAGFRRRGAGVQELGALRRLGPGGAGASGP